MYCQIGRKALFAGKDYIAMVKLIVNVLGERGRESAEREGGYRTVRSCCTGRTIDRTGGWSTGCGTSTVAYPY